MSEGESQDAGAQEAGAQGSGSQDWREGLPESVRGWEEVQTSQSADAFWDQVSGMRSRLGRSLSIPTQEAGVETREEFLRKAVEHSNGRLTVLPSEDDEAAMAAYRTAQGIPDSVEDYAFPDMGEDFPRDLMPESRAKQLKEMALRHGLPKDKFSALAKDMLALDLATLQEQRESVQRQQSELQEEWSDGYDQQYQRIATLLDATNAPPELIQAASSKTLGASTAKWLSGLVQNMGSEAAELARRTGGVTMETRESAEQKLAEIGLNPEHPYWNVSHPDHYAWVAPDGKYIKLMEVATGQKARPLPRAGFAADDAA